MTGLDLGTLSDLLKSGASTSVDLVDTALAAASASPGVFITLLADRARAEARASAERRRAGKALGPYDGIPYAVKDLFDVVGSVTTAGSRTREDAAMPDADAALVAKLNAHGLIPLGKANLSEFAFSGLGLNPHFGTPSPAYDPRRVPGGSSSGSAIAIERGIVPVALGSDTAGSLRVPAAFNHIVGFRPSHGHYDATGVFPLAVSFDVPGPMARTVADLAIVDGLMREGGQSRPQAMPHFLLDLGALESATLNHTIRAEMLRLVAAIEASGARVERRHINVTAETRAVIDRLGWLGGIEGASLHSDLLDGPRRSMVDARVVGRLEAARALPTDVADQLRAIRRDLMAATATELGDAILLSPTVGHVAPLLASLEADAKKFAAVNLATLSPTMIASFLGLPALAMPMAHGAIGSAQLAAQPKCDDAVLAAGLWLEGLALDFI